MRGTTVSDFALWRNTGADMFAELCAERTIFVACLLTICSQKRAFVSNDMCMIELEFPVGRYVHLLAQDTSRGEDGFRLAWSADCPMSLVDAAGQPIVAGLVPGSLQPIATASSPFDERHR
eukprot:TRINITY_DN4257_c0_g2_i1.p2 TRINITY_DN4257_c0_g2~~TRINITY_DN4257_c0_g2_i1.p2  ORF type:complete len:121 (-),score=13.88 TRINITY_DN4257_c0_g2_i1:1052-1414(-)